MDAGDSLVKLKEVVKSENIGEKNKEKIEDFISTIERFSDRAFDGEVDEAFFIAGEIDFEELEMVLNEEDVFEVDPSVFEEYLYYREVTNE